MIRINLIHDRVAIEVRKVKGEFLIGIAVFSVLLMLIIFFWRAKAGTINRLTVQKDEISRQKEQFNRISRKIKRHKKMKEELGYVIESIISLLDMQKGPTRVIDNINMKLPSEVWLTKVVAKGGDIKIDGYSFSNPGIALLMDNLKKGGKFSAVELFGIDQVALYGESVKKFTLSLHLADKVKEEEKKDDNR